MTRLTTTSCPTCSELAGAWKLAPRSAVMLAPTSDGILRVAQGGLWATVDGPHAGRGNDSGDHVLAPGRSLWLRAGQRVVIESWSRDADAHFSWDPVQVEEAARRLDLAAVSQPLRDLRAAGALAAQALARLVLGLGRLALAAVRPSGFAAAL